MFWQGGVMRMGLFGLFFAWAFFVTALNGIFCPVNERRIANSAWRTCWFAPECQFTCRVTVARVKRTTALAPLHNDVTFFALRAFDTDSFLNFFDEFTFRVARTAPEFAKSAAFESKR